MALEFERGHSQEARGHALLYFRSSLDPEKLLATYVVVLPIGVDIAKYLPPFLASQMGSFNFKDLSAFAFPPVPEEVESYEEIQHLAQVRDDDLIYGGSRDPSDIQGFLHAVSDIVYTYSSLYRERLTALPAPASPPPAAEMGVEEVLYSLMSEKDRLEELSKLVGKLRFAVERGYEATAQEAEERIRLLIKHFPENYRLDRLLEAAKSPTEQGTQLTSLYLERCYKLSQEDYGPIPEIEARIQALESREGL